MTAATAPVDVIAVGETMGCLVLRGHRHPGGITLAGAESNVAIGLAFLGHRTRWASRLGTDRLGDHIVDRLRESGVDPYVTRDPVRQTGLAIKELSPGRTVVRYYRRDSAASAMSIRDAPPLTNAEWLHLSGITPALSPACAELVPALMRQAGGQRVRVSFDVNLRPVLWDSLSIARDTIRLLCREADLVFVGDDESRALELGDTLEEFIRGNVLRPEATVVFKRGAHGPQAFAAGVRYASAAVPTEVVDLTGAGDAFAAGFLSGQLRRLSIPQCLRLGSALASQVIGVDTDFVDPPDPARRTQVLSSIDEVTDEATRGVP